MGKANGVREVGYFDCDGGGQIVVDGNSAYIGHVNGTTGTTIVDVSDPKKPRHLANVPTAPGIHAHKVRVANGLMLVNREHPPRRKGPPLTPEELAEPVGLGIYDVSDPAQAEGDHHVALRRQRRASLHVRRPLRVFVARDGGVCRQHRADPRSRRIRASPKRSAAGGCPGSGPRAARRRAGRAARIAATIRSGSATGSTPATGTAAP